MTYSIDQFLNIRSAYGPTVDAAGDRVYFVSDVSGSPQAWSLALRDAGAWPEPVGVGFDRVHAAYPSSRAGRLIATADHGGNERTQLHLIDGVGALPEALTTVGDAVHVFGSWHPDGRTIAFSSNERDPRYFDVYLLDVESRERRLLFRRDATLYPGRFSPDGSRLVVQEVESPSVQRLHVLDISSETGTTLTDAQRPARFQNPSWTIDGASVLCLSDHGREFVGVARLAPNGELAWVAVDLDWDVDDYALSPDGRLLVYAVNHGGRSAVRLLELATGRSFTVDMPPGQACDTSRWQPSFSWLPDGSGVTLTVATPRSAPDIYLVDVHASSARPLTRSWSAGVHPDRLADAELVDYPTFDDRRIPAFVFRPPSADAQPRPAVFFVHGGPESQTRASFNPVIQYLVQRGLVVVAPNVRGSSGYGTTYLHLDDVERRPDAVADLAAGARWAASSGLADPRRIAVMGGSYGGFMVLAALTTYPELWAAGVDIVGIANFVTFLERTGPWRRHLREAEYGSLERDRALLEELSPIRRADQITAPLMVVHGANDPRVPIHEAEQIVAILRGRGRAVELLRYEDEGHGLVKLRNRRDAYPRIVAFLERHLGLR